MLDLDDAILLHHAPTDQLTTYSCQVMACLSMAQKQWDKEADDKAEAAVAEAPRRVNLLDMRSLRET